MSDSKKEPDPKDEESWGSVVPHADGMHQTRSSGIVYLHNSGVPLPDADSREEFVRFAAEQVLRIFGLGSADRELGIIPNSNKMAFAAAYLFVQGVFVKSDEVAERMTGAGEGAKIELILLQATRESEFNSDRLWNIRRTAQALFTPVAPGETQVSAESRVLAGTFRWYRRLAEALAPHHPHTVVRYVYVSRGDTARIGEALQNEADGIVAMTRRAVAAPNDITFEFIAERDLIV